MNTRIRYEYRDGGNYRWHGELVLEGEMTDAKWQRIRATCEDRGMFIAHQVGFPEVFAYRPGPHHRKDEKRDSGYDYDEKTDHCWHRFLNDPQAWELTSDSVTNGCDVLELVRIFESASNVGWKVFDPAERFGL